MGRRSFDILLIQKIIFVNIFRLLKMKDKWEESRNEKIFKNIIFNYSGNNDFQLYGSTAYRKKTIKIG